MEDGLIIKDSPYDIETTYSKLRAIIGTNPNLKILFELDHSVNAAFVDLKLSPTKIIMFGNPKLGTPLIQANQTAAIDLPQKIIVYVTDDKKTRIAYNDPIFTQRRHSLTGVDVVLKKISDALDNITSIVISV